MNTMMQVQAGAYSYPIKRIYVMQSNFVIKKPWL